MDRQTVYSGALPRTVDALQAQQNAMVAFAKQAELLLGTSTLVDGFTCTPTTPASLNVLVTPGTIMQLENLEATTWSSLAQDLAHSVLKQGIMLNAVQLAITPPGTVGYSQVYLIEAQYQDLDTGSTVLPYFNADNPAAPLGGPGNAGTAQNTVRKGVVQLQLKAGVAATTGTQTAPTADAGWVGLFMVTVANGQTTVTSGNVVTLATAPFLTAHGKLPQIPTGVQNGDWVGADDSGTANAYAIQPTPGVTAYQKYQKFRVKIANANTQMVCTLAVKDVNGNSLGAKQIVLPGGLLPAPGQIGAGMIAELVYDGSLFEMVSAPNAQTRTLTGNANWYVNTATGSDAYDGTSATVINANTGPFKTIQRGVTETSKYNMNGYSQTVHVADGAFSESVVCPPTNGTGTVFVIGNEATPISCTVTGPLDGSGNMRSAFILGTSGQYKISGFRLAVTSGGIATDAGYGVFCNGGFVELANLRFGPCPGGHVFGFGCTLEIETSIVIEAGANAATHVNAQSGCKIIVPSLTANRPAYVILGAVTFSGTFVNASGAGAEVDLNYLSLSGAGSVTGQRYAAVGNGVINSNGGGASYFPGTIAGTTSTGGQYL